jgi:hypothetical protein
MTGRLGAAGIAASRRHQLVQVALLAVILSF